MTKIQEDIFNSFDPRPKISFIEYKDCKDGNLIVIVKSLLKDDYYYKYTIAPDGEATRETFYRTNTRKLGGWSMEERGWTMTKLEEVTGYEPPEITPNKIVIEENKMKEIKEEKKMDFTDRIYDRYLERVRQYVSDNADELREYKAELLEGKVDDMTDDEIEDDVKAVIDSNVEYESVSDLINIDNCDIEDILNDYDIL